VGGSLRPPLATTRCGIVYRGEGMRDWPFVGFDFHNYEEYLASWQAPAG
jgi:hypothetical protein